MEVFHGGSAFYPRDAVLAADEDARATPRKQAAAWTGAWRRWTQQLCPSGSASPLLEYYSKPYPIILLFCKIRPNFELKSKIC